MEYADSCPDYNEKFGHFCVEEFEISGLISKFQKASNSLGFLSSCINDVGFYTEINKERLRNIVLKRFVGSLTILASNTIAIIILTLTLACFIIFGGKFVKAGQVK